MACESKRLQKTLSKAILAKSDQVLLWNAAGIDDRGRTRWYEHKSEYHRHYMRALHAEARRRGLDVPEYPFP